MKHVFSTLALLAVCLQAAAYGPESIATIYVKAGMGSRLGKPGGATELDRQHAQKLATGLSTQLELVLNNSSSIITTGLIANNYHTTATDRVVVTYSNGSQQTGDMTDLLNIWLFAPATYIRGCSSNGRFGYSLGVGLGVIGIRDKGSLIDYSVMKSGWCLGGVTGVCLEYCPTPKLSIGLSTNLVVGNLTSYKTKEYSTGNIQKTSNVSESLSHIDTMLSIGFSY